MATRSLPRPSKPKFSQVECSFRLEQDSGLSCIIGIDEVGRGCLAGPVVVAGVVFRPDQWFADDEWLTQINDSKKVREKLREELAEKIRSRALSVAVSFCSPEEVDRINILQATFKAARDVVRQISEKVSGPIELILMDGSQKIPMVNLPQHPVIGGDRVSKSIAAASIVAKVTRDQWMQNISQEFPAYGFEKHKGYGTKDHIAALRKWGPCRLHRRSFLKKFEAVSHGQNAEAAAADFLKQNGFQILFQNWSCPGAEIDLIASKDDELHFFEVRYRSRPVEISLIFPPSKQAQVKKTVDYFIRANPSCSGQVYHLHLLTLSPNQPISAYWDVFKF